MVKRKKPSVPDEPNTPKEPKGPRVVRGLGITPEQAREHARRHPRAMEMLAKK